MKIQDLVFIAVLVLLIIWPKQKLPVILGLASIIISIPLFYFHIFFTAQRLTMYGAGFFLLGIVKNLKLRKD